MKIQRRIRSVTVGASALLVVALAGGGLHTAYAAESVGNESGEVIDALSAMNGIYQTQDGRPISVEAEVGDVAERTITGRTADGEPVQIIIQASGLSDEDRKRIEDDAASTTPDPATQGFTTIEPGPESGTLEAAPLDLDPKNWEVVSVIATTTSTASFAWPASDGFDVVIDGDLEGSSQGGAFSVTGLKPGVEYAVDLVATENGTARSAEGLEFTSTRLVSVTTFTGSESVDADRLVSPLTYQPYYNKFVHKAFIPDNRVAGSQCNFLEPGWEFGGDNRSWVTPSVDEPWGPANYRTMMFVNVNWDNPAPYDIEWTKNVGKTQLFHNGVLKNTLYASMDGMTFEDPSAGASYAQIYLRHASGNPGCKLWNISYSGAITYGEWVQFYRSGTITADGYRFRAPAHELYGAFTNSSGNNVWRTITRRSNEGFQCLLGNLFCPLDFYKASAVY